MTYIESGHHPPDACAGDAPCAIHSPSDHHMRDWPYRIRSASGLLERLCPHGVGHPDPDSLAWLERLPTMSRSEAGAHAVHGCDGCCTPPQRQGGRA